MHREADARRIGEVVLRRGGGGGWRQEAEGAEGAEVPEQAGSQDGRGERAAQHRGNGALDVAVARAEQLHPPQVAQPRQRLARPQPV